MSSSGLEWDSLGCPLVGLPSRCKSPFPTDSDNTNLWHCQIHSLWSVSSATGCNASSRSEGSRRCRLKREEDEEGRRQWKRAGKEPGGSGRVKEVSQSCSYWACRHLPPPSFFPSTKSTPPPLLLCSVQFLSGFQVPSHPLLRLLSPPSLMVIIALSSFALMSNLTCQGSLAYILLCFQQLHLWQSMNMSWTFFLELYAFTWLYKLLWTLNSC